MVRALAVQAASGSGRKKGGIEITAFETSEGPATGASGNPIGIVHPFISKDWNLASQFMQRGVETTLRWVQELGGEESGSSSTAWAGITGVMQLAEDTKKLRPGRPSQPSGPICSGSLPNKPKLSWDWPMPRLVASGPPKAVGSNRQNW